MSDERRQYLRLDAKLPITYREVPTDTLTPSVSRNISGGGICIRVSQPLENGTHLSVEVRLPDGTDAQFEADVVWCRSHQDPRGRVTEVGLSFTKIDPKVRGAILRLTGPPAT
jgi:c-di-GMP-binding flagellar brake protein YcgR